jgi:hypothetical protein
LEEQQHTHIPWSSSSTERYQPSEDPIAFALSGSVSTRTLAQLLAPDHKAGMKLEFLFWLMPIFSLIDWVILSNDH